MKSVLKGAHFPSVDKVKAKMAQLLNDLGVDECVYKEGEYIEGNKS